MRAARPPSGARRPAHARTRHGLLAHALADSPFGPLVVIATPAGLVRLLLPGEDADAEVARIAIALDLRPAPSPRRLDRVRRELDGYFAGRLRAFTVALDLSAARGFRREVLERLTALPYGTVVTYSVLAALAGRPHAARAAGHACATNPLPIVVPCHRAVRRDGGLGGYTGGLDRKRFLLGLEGVLVGPPRPRNAAGGLR